MGAECFSVYQMGGSLQHQLSGLNDTLCSVQPGQLDPKKHQRILWSAQTDLHSSVRYLEKRNYISLTPGTRDRREKIIFLTEEGRAYAGELLTPLFEAEENICRTIGIERLEEMINTNDLYNLLFEKEMKRRIKHHD